MSSHEISLRQDGTNSKGISTASLAVYDDSLIRLSAGRVRTVGNRKRRRFAPVDEKTYYPPQFIDLPIGLSVSDVDKFFREQRLDDITSKLSRNELELGDPDIRPPSPPPTYDHAGARTNSRETRCKTSMQREYHRLVSFMTKNLANYVAPLDYKIPKITRRVEIPQDRYPDINFTGMILGPRGLNHRRLEEETGCQISIRGRGSRGQSVESQTEEELQMPLHVCIICEDEDKINIAINLIEPIVDPLHPGHEQERLKGLEQLAIITGTTKTLQERQLKLLEADYQEDMSYTMAAIVCKTCGDRGHVTSDCPTLKKNDDSIADWRIDNEYSKLISEISKPGTTTTISQPVKTSTHPLAMQSIPAHVPPPKSMIPPIGFPPGFNMRR